MIEKINSIIPELDPDTDAILVVLKTGDRHITIDHGTSENLKDCINSLAEHKKLSKVIKEAGIQRIMKILKEDSLDG